MEIPSMLYGRASAVKSRARKLLKRFVDEGVFDELHCGPMMDTRDATGLLLVAPERVQLSGDHFHCYALSLAVFDLASDERLRLTMQAWMRWSLLEPWRLLGVAEQHTTGPLAEDRASLRPYAEAVVRFWPALAGEGKRYGPTLDQIHDAWEAMGNLQFALARLGIPGSDLRIEPPGGPAVFLARLDKMGHLP